MTESSAAKQAKTTPSDDRPSNGHADNMKASISEGESATKESGSKANSQLSPTPKSDSTATAAHASPKKRRKVNHGKRSFFRSACCRDGTPAELHIRGSAGDIWKSTLLTRLPCLQHASTADVRI
ncbi:hypothetical protein ASPZODRAFT_1901209 [Penicilliopsis zonata CBS 506.65]|uniref:Uncharacterized protein n=1 Tax=Penicilliopsis zonata CBS 506.65 TaxID=1073090 RepID=A0A1L9SIV0_9EURO|nr:hypothetical protein ASPZODRAFT_1901209 [Penicilliopsis zonata CBS 506.65]OJJ47128.1 hypothetical protein ASPZODRAFT_1901209 [Penicilliopsis zonata CBS 506.65]